ncbi:hypothetical protein [Actinacidiphila oryziradicis]|jgi:hypothetical protein|uniref:Uncharacterized protein n=1 Tax=Actinacidiphila oryziradicis TaxID=2571141 RepID=A0A4U0SUU5_9ACTN|nr:hypothetical protein [Actinacidiphila oryziradicis]TKA12331.1 hypothetical protein FCI23_05815 [Actinacidiphila oryziradicis]
MPRSVHHLPGGTGLDDLALGDDDEAPGAVGSARWCLMSSTAVPDSRVMVSMRPRICRWTVT